MTTSMADGTTIRLAGPSDVPGLSRLRREWTAEDIGARNDPDFEARFAAWYEKADRLTWIAESGEYAVGMLNMAVFDRMPRPGQPDSHWGYVANVFVLGEFRNWGIGAGLLAAAVGYADQHGFARLVLRPAKRAVPFYQRAGFTLENDLMLRED